MRHMTVNNFIDVFCYALKLPMMLNVFINVIFNISIIFHQMRIPSYV